jgi:hypothetical protein
MGYFVLPKTIIFTPEACDVFAYVDEGKGWTSTVSRWAIGRYDHVSLYLGRAFADIPFLYESNGRGVSIVNVQHQTGRLVTVLRPQLSDIDKTRVIRKGIEIASDPKSYYDYLAYVTNCLPRVLKEKFPWLPIPYQYHRDAAMICSEAVEEAFFRAGIDVLPQNLIESVSRDGPVATWEMWKILGFPNGIIQNELRVIPLPGDFVKSLLFNIMFEGRLFEDIQP